MTELASLLFYHEIFWDCIVKQNSCVLHNSIIIFSFEAKNIQLDNKFVKKKYMNTKVLRNGSCKETMKFLLVTTFGDFTAMIIQIVAFWLVTPYSLLLFTVPVVQKLVSSHFLFLLPRVSIATRMYNPTCSAPHILQPWSWRHVILPKHRCFTAKVHGVQTRRAQLRTLVTTSRFQYWIEAGEYIFTLWPALLFVRHRLLNGDESWSSMTPAGFQGPLI